MPEIHAGEDPADLFAKAGVIPVANLHRLDLKPGDVLAVIAPDECKSVQALEGFRYQVQYHMRTQLGVKVAVFPPGTKLDVIPEQN